MRWSRFGLGVLPAVPAVVVSIVVLAMGGPESEPDETSDTTAHIALDRPSPRRPSTANPRRAPRTRATTQLRAPSRGGQPEAPAAGSPVERCCNELKRYRRATPGKFRETYDEIISMCDGMGNPAIPGDEPPMLGKIKAALKEKDAPYIPPSCR